MGGGKVVSGDIGIVDGWVVRVARGRNVGH